VAGRLGAHHVTMLRLALAHVDYLDATIAALDGASTRR